jgi:hypothetical protein
MSALFVEINEERAVIEDSHEPRLKVKDEKLGTHSG